MRTTVPCFQGLLEHREECSHSPNESREEPADDEEVYDARERKITAVLGTSDKPDLVEAGGHAGDEPHPALRVRGDDKLGALARIQQKLDKAGVSVFASLEV